jgi:hypothetical protein
MVLWEVFLLPFWRQKSLFVFQVCDSRHSELIPCLDRQLHSQLKLKLNLSLMEHYERHCPPPHRRLNCLIPPPPNYKVWKQTPQLYAWHITEKSWLINSFVKPQLGPTFFYLPDGACWKFLGQHHFLKHWNNCIVISSLLSRGHTLWPII